MIERDPNRLTGLTEVELERSARRRARRSGQRFFVQKLLQYWWIVLLTMVALVLVATSMWSNEPEKVVRYGALVILAGAATNYWISSSARSELDEAIALNRDLNSRNVAAHEARLVLKQADRDAFVVTTAPPPDFGPLIKDLEHLKDPFVVLEIGLVLFGTAMSVFGDWMTNLLHCGAIQF